MLPVQTMRIDSRGRLGQRVRIKLDLIRGFLTLFSRMPDSQHVNRGILYLVAYFVVPNQNAAHLARLEFFQLVTDAGLFQQTRWRCGQ